MAVPKIEIFVDKSGQAVAYCPLCLNLRDGKDLETAAIKMYGHLVGTHNAPVGGEWNVKMINSRK